MIQRKENRDVYITVAGAVLSADIFVSDRERQTRANHLFVVIHSSRERDKSKDSVYYSKYKDYQLSYLSTLKVGHNCRVKTEISAHSKSVV